MSGNPYEKAFSGKRFGIQAQAWNTLMDMAQVQNASGIDGGGIGASAFKRNSLVLVKNNNTSSGVGQFCVLGIDDIGIAPSNNIDSFKNEMFLSCVTPTVADSTGYFVVTVDPIAAGEMGLAFATGVFPVKVNIVDTHHVWADVKDSDTTQLQSGVSGVAQILWSESGTGSKWAVVRLGNYGPPEIKWKLTGTVTGGGKYLARSVFGQSAATSSGTLAMPEGMTVASSDNILLLNATEDGSSGHALSTGIFGTGEIVGTATDGKMIVLSRIAETATSLTIAATQVQAFPGGTGVLSNRTTLTSAFQTLPNGTITIPSNGIYLVTARIEPVIFTYNLAGNGLTSGTLEIDAFLYNVGASSNIDTFNSFVLGDSTNTFSGVRQIAPAYTTAPSMQYANTLTLNSGVILGMRAKMTLAGASTATIYTSALAISALKIG